MERVVLETGTPGARPLTRLHARTTIRKRVGKVAKRMTAGRPYLLVAFGSLVALGLSYVGAFMLRFEFAIPPRHAAHMLRTLPFVLLVQSLMFYACGVHRILWAYVDFRDLLRVLRACGYSAGILLLINQVIGFPEVLPRSVLVLDA